MPIYEYQCTSCHHHFDLMQKISDAPAEKCPECSKNSLVKLVSAAGFQLKGTGWYATDFKDKGKQPTTSPTNNAKPAAAPTTVTTATTSSPASSPTNKGDSK